VNLTRGLRRDAAWIPLVGHGVDLVQAAHHVGAVHVEPGRIERPGSRLEQQGRANGGHTTQLGMRIRSGVAQHQMATERVPEEVHRSDVGKELALERSIEVSAQAGVGEVLARAIRTARIEEEAACARPLCFDQRTSHVAALDAAAEAMHDEQRSLRIVVQSAPRETQWTDVGIDEARRPALGLGPHERRDGPGKERPECGRVPEERAEQLVEPASRRPWIVRPGSHERAF
jgi:hypothetical protein